MASQSLYRKWRSQTFSDLIGQEAVTQTLQNAVRDGRLVHAYLFCGPRGTGKTSTARLLAKAANCAHPQGGEPCNECLSCLEITAGHSPDVIEIDAASNTGVDNIRDLRENVHLLGVGGRYKFYIVDEAHMLSTQAFNALLKTLEEPPPHVIFVLATTEAHKVPPTVVSRCQPFFFRRFRVRDLIRRLQYVAGQEGLELEPPAAELLARAAGGGMRDALSLLDQAFAFCGARIDRERTRTMLGLADPGAIRALIEHVAGGDAAAGLHLINDLVESGADLRQLNNQFAEEWRALLLARAGADVAELMERSDEDVREITSLAQRFSLEDLTESARIFARNETPARGLPVPQLALELSFLDCINLRSRGAHAEHAAAHQPLPAPTARPSLPPPETTLPAPPLPAAPTPPASPVRPRVREEEPQRESAAPPIRESAPTPETQEILARAQSQWDLVKQVCKQKSHSVAALLHSARPILVEPGPDAPVLVLQAAYQFHLEKLREPASKAAVEWALYQVLSQPLRVRLTLRSDSEGASGSRQRGGTAEPSSTSRSGPPAEPDASTGDPTPDNIIPMRRPAPPRPAAAETPGSPEPSPDPERLEAEVRADPVIQSLLRVEGIELVNVRFLGEKP